MANIEKELENFREVEKIFSRFQREEVSELRSSLKGSTATELGEEVNEREIIRNFLEEKLQQNLQNLSKSLNNIQTSLARGRIEEREVNKFIESWGRVKVIKELLVELDE